MSLCLTAFRLMRAQTETEVNIGYLDLVDRDSVLQTLKASQGPEVLRSVTLGCSA